MSTRITPLVLLLVSVALSGCRLYGGYGSEEATYVQIQTAVERYGAQAERMEGDHKALAAASAENAALIPYAARMAEIVEAQAAALEQARAQVAGVSESSSYRVLNRTLGALVSRQQVVDDSYSRLLADIQGDRVALLGREDPSRYQVVPAYYARIEASLEQISLREAIRAD